MKTRKKLLIALLSATCITAGAFGLAACKDDTADVDPQIKAAYELYVDAVGDSAMTYDQWLASIKGADGAKGEKGDKGDKGDDGATWLFGEVAPAATAGKAGDFYLDTKTFDVYSKSATGWEKKGNIKGATGEDGDKGDKGDDGVGIANITLTGNVLKIFFTDTEKAPIEFELPEELFHVHEYGDPVTVLEPELEKYGLAFKRCTVAGCTHSELVVLPNLEGKGTIEEPKFIMEDGDVVVPTEDFNYTYYKYTAKEDGYLLVQTPKESGDYCSRFYVYATEKFDSDYDDDLYCFSDGEGYNKECYLKKGESAYIKASGEDYKVEDQYIFSVKLYGETDLLPYTITVKGPDEETVPNATVKLYTGERDENWVYTFTEAYSATTDENGKATFNIKLISTYYFDVTVPTESDYISLVLDNDYPETYIEPLTFDKNVDVEIGKNVDYNITVVYPDGTTPVTGVTVKLYYSAYDDEAAVESVVDDTGKVHFKTVANEYIVVIDNIPEGYELASGTKLTERTQTIKLQKAPQKLTITNNAATVNAVAGERYSVSKDAHGVYTLTVTKGYIDTLTNRGSLVFTNGEAGYKSGYTFEKNASNKITKVTFKTTYYPVDWVFTVSENATVNFNCAPTEFTKEEVGNSLTIDALAKTDYTFHIEAGKTYTITTDNGVYLYKVCVDDSYSIVSVSQVIPSNKKDGDSVTVDKIAQKNDDGSDRTDNNGNVIYDEYVLSFTTTRAKDYITVALENAGHITITVTDAPAA